MDLKKLVREIPDFPIAGVFFRDISPILETPAAFQSALSKLVSHFDIDGIDHFVGIESRGFILAAALAAKFDKGFIPLRKAGKLPPPVQQLKYSLEYGEATLEMRHGSGRVMVVDDVLATGGTLQAGLDLCAKAGYSVMTAAVLINLKHLNQMKFRGEPIHAVLTY